MKGKVLIIEDDKHWQNALRECIEDAGYFVKIATNLAEALRVIEMEKFHFITIDMSLEDANVDANTFGGWTILGKIEKLRIKDITPAMVITGYEQEYKELVREKHLESIFFMGKGEFNEQELINIIDKEVSRIDLRFYGDHRET